MINTVLFDLDGTLLPINQMQFVNEYMGELVKKFAPMGFDGKLMAKALWAGTEGMMKNDGSRLNEEVFWEIFAGILGKEILDYQPEFEKFYDNEFQNVKKVADPNPLADACVKLLKKKGYQVVAATNPLFPAIATINRMKWAGLDINDFELITTFENSSYCKPNPEYYKAILSRIGKNAEECLMVGNDVEEDMCTAKMGMEVFLLRDFIISRNGVDIRQYPQGGFAELFNYLEKLPVVG